MVNVSKNSLSDAMWEKVWTQCVDMFAKQKTRKEVADSLHVLFTKSERILLAKRVALIVMLRGGYSSRAISEALHMSTSTIFQWRERIQCGEFKTIERRLQNPDTTSRILATIEALLYASMPPIAGRNRFGEAMKNIEKARQRGSLL
jgi:Trp operon repressor